MLGLFLTCRSSPQIDNELPDPVVHDFQTVCPPGVVELAKNKGMNFNAMANSGVAGAKM